MNLSYRFIVAYDAAHISGNTSFQAKFWRHAVPFCCYASSLEHDDSCTALTSDWHTERPAQKYIFQTYGGRVNWTTFSNIFCWMQMHEFRLKSHWRLFLRVQLPIFQHWFRWWLGAVQATSHYLNQWWLVYWRIYSSLGPNELMTILNSYWNLTEVCS